MNTTDDRILGKPCWRCGSKVTLEEVQDCRPQWEKEKHPLGEENKTMLWCSCNHPGDGMVGGFF